MIEHDGCDGCKYYSTTICVPEESPCFECENAHKSKTLTDKYEPMTNADRIRNMSDDKLAEWIAECDMNCDECMDTFGKCIKKNCKNRVIEWLQSEVKEQE